MLFIYRLAPWSVHTDNRFSRVRSFRCKIMFDGLQPNQGQYFSMPWLQLEGNSKDVGTDVRKKNMVAGMPGPRFRISIVTCGEDGSAVSQRFYRCGQWCRWHHLRQHRQRHDRWNHLHRRWSCSSHSHSGFQLSGRITDGGWPWKHDEWDSGLIIVLAFTNNDNVCKHRPKLMLAKYKSYVVIFVTMMCLPYWSSHCFYDIHLVTMLIRPATCFYFLMFCK